jgi:hypothetical protein
VKRRLRIFQCFRPLNRPISIGVLRTSEGVYFALTSFSPSQAFGDVSLMSAGWFEVERVLEHPDKFGPEPPQHRVTLAAEKANGSKVGCACKKRFAVALSAGQTMAAVEVLGAIFLGRCINQLSLSRRPRVGSVAVPPRPE